MLEKGKPSEKVGRKVTDLSLRRKIGWQNCRAISEPSKILNNKIRTMEVRS